MALLYSFFNSPFGYLILGEYEEKLCLCDWRYRKARPEIDARIQLYCGNDWQEKDTQLLQETRSQLMAYLEGKLQTFDLPLFYAGTDFQQTVWNALMEIPYGQTISYLDLAKKLGNQGAIRAVATANGANALSIIVPCHRVIGENGQLTGYAGGLPAKRKLLELEGSLYPKGQLRLFET